MKLKRILFSLLVGAIIFNSCKGNDTPKDNFDHAAQALLDDQKINEYLETHFYTPPAANENFGVIDTILNGETPIKDIVQTKNITFEGVDYNLYYIIDLPEGSGEHPTKLDRVFTKYKGTTIDNEQKVFDERSVNYTWFTLTGGAIPGWTYGLPLYKAASTIISAEDEPFEFDQPGKGVLFIPSGLAYRNLGAGAVLPNTSLTFHIVLGAIERNDLDADGLYSLYEDLNNDQNFDNDDTDGDKKPNFRDTDDDGDRILTKYENADPNEDHNPSDALDTDGDNIPNYLDDDDDGDGILTSLEEADPNNDGNPDDAVDSDGDNIPDYLDPTN
jgi:hypothetical protein